jgi:hypothetical protein
MFRFRCQITVFHLCWTVFFTFELRKLWSNVLDLWNSGDVPWRERVRLYNARLLVVAVSDDDAYHVGLLHLSLRQSSDYAASTVQGDPMLLEPIQNRLKRITRQASWTKPRKFRAWYSQRTRMRRCHWIQAKKRSTSQRSM